MPERLFIQEHLGFVDARNGFSRPSFALGPRVEFGGSGLFWEVQLGMNYFRMAKEIL